MTQDEAKMLICMYSGVSKVKAVYFEKHSSSSLLELSRQQLNFVSYNNMALVISFITRAVLCSENMA